MGGIHHAAAFGDWESRGRLIINNHNVFESDDLDQTREHIARTYCPHRLSINDRGGRLDAWLNHKRLSHVGVGTMSYGTEVSISGVEDQDFLLIMLPFRGAADIGMGRRAVQCMPGRAAVTSTVELDRMRWSQDCSQLVVQISAAAIDRHLTLMTGRALREPVRFAPEMEAHSGHPSWWNYVALLLDELSASQGQGNQASMAHLETLLIVKLLESQPSNYHEQLQPQACRIAPQHVRRVERFIADNVERPISLEELVTVSGVSARALFDGFRRFRDQSPMAYLRSIRLERVRQDLLRAQPGETVTAIACRWGFYQFGRFAGEYRRVYGELPSETLRTNG